MATNIKLEAQIPVHDLVIVKLVQSGVSLMDVANIRLEDVDFETNTIRTSTGSVKLDKYCMELMQEVIGSPFYYNYDGTSIVMEENGYLIRSLEQPFSKASEEEIRKRLQRAQDFLGIELPL